MKKSRLLLVSKVMLLKCSSANHYLVYYLTRNSQFVNQKSDLI